MINLMQKSGDDSSDLGEDSDGEEKANFNRFLISRNQQFLQCMSEFVKLRKVFAFLESNGRYIEYKEFKQIIKDKVEMEGYVENILLNAKNLIDKEMLVNSSRYQTLLTQGVVHRQEKCAYCKGKLGNRLDKQDVWFFRCSHVFHARCLSHSEGKCSVCFDVLEAF